MVGSHKGTCPDYQSAHFCGNDKFKSEVNQRTLCYNHLKINTFCERHKYLAKVNLYFAETSDTIYCFYVKYYYVSVEKIIDYALNRSYN